MFNIYCIMYFSYCSSLQNEGKYITLGEDYCQSWIMNLEPDYLRKLLVEISRAAIGNDIITISSKSEKAGFSPRRKGFICGNWFNESTPFDWFLLTSTADIISIHWLDGIGLNFPRRCLQRRTFEILGYMVYGTWIFFDFQLHLNYDPDHSLDAPHLLWLVSKHSSASKSSLLQTWKGLDPCRVAKLR